MKKTLILLFCLLFFPLASAAVDIKPQSEIPIALADSEAPVHFTLKLTNTGPTDTFEIYSFVGVTIKPESGYLLESGKETTVEFDAYLSKNIRKNTRGFFSFEYEIYSPINKATKSKLLVKIVDPQDMLEIRPINFQPGDPTVLVSVRNLENVNIDDIKVDFNSPLFAGSKTLSLRPYEVINVSLPYSTDEEAKALLSGTYPVEAKVTYKDIEGTRDLEIKYLEKGGLSLYEENKGLIVQTTTIKKTNEGNVNVNAFVTERKNAFTRLVTTFHPKPDNATKNGLYIDYDWQKNLAPSESLIVTTTTNYTLPFVILIIIVALVIFVRIYTLTNLSLVKRVSFVKTRGGEFALKVTLHVKARKNIDSITITDHIPHTMKLYDKFGIKPDTIDESTRRLTWKISRLNAGEGRVYSYVVYSKIRVVGSFELPLAHSTYTKDGKHHSLYSNKTSFVSETLRE